MNEKPYSKLSDIHEEIMHGEDITPAYVYGLIIVFIICACLMCYYKGKLDCTQEEVSNTMAELCNGQMRGFVINKHPGRYICARADLAE